MSAMKVGFLVPADFFGQCGLSLKNLSKQNPQTGRVSVLSYISCFQKHGFCIVSKILWFCALFLFGGHTVHLLWAATSVTAVWKAGHLIMSAGKEVLESASLRNRT